jgi:hypothetical protein
MGKSTGFDFEVDEMDGLDSEEESGSSTEDGAQELVNSLYEEPAEEEDDAGTDDVEAQMSAVAQRLLLAQYYQTLLNGSLFEGDTSPPALRVTKELRGFVRQRLAVLMGVKREPIGAAPAVVMKPQFTDDEVKALRAVAAKVNGLGTVPQAPSKPPEAPPVLKKVEAPVTAAPKLAAAKAPPTVQAKKPPAPITIQAKPGQRAGPPPRPAVKTAPKVADSRVPEAYRNDPTLTFKNGKVFVQMRDADDQPLWVQDLKTGKSEPMLKDVTQQAKPVPGTATILPTPSVEQANMVMQTAADSMLGMAAKKSEGMRVGGLFSATVVSNIVPGGGVENNAEGEDERP